MNPLLDPTARLVVGHRGCAAHAPENTLAALTMGLTAGAHAVEFDVRATADGVVVLMHDSTIDRTTGGTGHVHQLTLAQLRQARTPDGQPVPTLDEALATVGHAPVLIELKTPAASAETLRLLRRHGATGRALVDSMHADALRPFEDSGVGVGAGARRVASLIASVLLGRRARIAYDAICVPPRHTGLPLPLRRFARTMRSAGRAMHVWTVNDPASAQRLWSWGVNGIISDDPARILREAY